MVPWRTRGFRRGRAGGSAGLRGAEGSAVLEFAITLPLLVVFVVGIFDFSGAFNEKQKIEQAAQEGAIVAGAQPLTDISLGASSGTNPQSLQPVVAAVFNSLAGSGVISGCSLNPFPTPKQTALTWTYTISGCSSTTSDTLIIVVNRGWSAAPAQSPEPYILGTTVQVTFPYHWRFNSVIQLLFPGPSSYSSVTTLTETAIVHNQM
jgi:Flp pilus assembly protein TadG